MVNHFSMAVVTSGSAVGVSCSPVPDEPGGSTCATSQTAVCCGQLSNTTGFACLTVESYDQLPAAPESTCACYDLSALCCGMMDVTGCTGVDTRYTSCPGAQSQFCCAISNVSDSPNIPKNSSSAQLQHMLRGMSLPKIAPSGYSQ
ncbi:hypothetical protein WJX84_004482 [Apatococcus fuscideae]|uniref:Uncharacterized protein n=1 Tax=Apatococcus fuscideae TaxID=2026836 RepID=A0AAW1T9Z3_9CHLO